MALRTWPALVSSGVLGLCLTGGAKPPVTPTPPGVNGQETPPATRDFHEPHSPPAPRPLPETVRESVPSRYAPPSAEIRLADALAGLDQTPPFRLVSATAHSPEALGKARAAFQMGEMYFRCCEAEEARRWYREVVAQAPGSPFALVAMERLSRTTTALYQSVEPPLADPDLPAGRNP